MQISWPLPSNLQMSGQGTAKQALEEQVLRLVSASVTQSVTGSAQHAAPCLQRHQKQQAGLLWLNTGPKASDVAHIHTSSR